MRLSLVDLEQTEASQLAGAEIVDPPSPGATGRFTLRVKWSHPVPMGKVSFRVKAYASPDGKAPPISVGIAEPGSEKRMQLLVKQNAPIDLAIRGALAEKFRDKIVEKGGEITPLSTSMDGGLVSVPTATIIIGLAAVAAICILVGMVTFATVLIVAMQKGYNIDDAGYKVAVGQGKSRQEHEMVFNIRQPGT